MTGRIKASIKVGTLISGKTHKKTLAHEMSDLLLDIRGLNTIPESESPDYSGIAYCGNCFLPLKSAAFGVH